MDLICLHKISYNKTVIIPGHVTVNQYITIIQQRVLILDVIPEGHGGFHQTCFFHQAYEAVVQPVDISSI